MAKRLTLEERAARFDRIRNRPAGDVAVESCAAQIVGAIERAASDGLMIVAGSFGNGSTSVDALGAVGREHPDYDLDVHAEVHWLAAETLDWNHDQMWAFVSGFDATARAEEIEGVATLARFIDPRAKKHPELVRLGQVLREGYVHGK